MQFALSGICGPLDVITPLSGFDEPLRKLAAGKGPQNYAKKNIVLSRMVESYRKTFGSRLGSSRDYFTRHMGPIKVRQRLGTEDFDNYRKFVVVRSPFDTVMSDYFWLNRSPGREYVPEWTESGFSDFLFKNSRQLARNELQYREFEGVENVTFLRYDELPDCLHPFCESLDLPDEWIRHFFSTRAKSGIRPAGSTYGDFFERNASLRSHVENIFPSLIEDFAFVP